MADTIKLLAVLEVDKDKRVRCQFPGCKQTIYKSIHVIADRGELKVIGSTCVTKGNYGDMGAPAYTGGGNGKLLTQAEREMLEANTAQLVQQLKTEYEARLAQASKAAAEKAEAERAASDAAAKRKAEAFESFLSDARAAAKAVPKGPRNYFENPNEGRLPWSWVDPRRSMLCVILDDACGWLRVQDMQGCHHLVPFPEYEGWDEFLPPALGTLNEWQQGFQLRNVVQALQYLRSMRPLVDEVCSSFAHAQTLRNSR